MRTTKLHLFFFGAAVGGAMALLYAPASGAATRDYLGRRTRDGQKRASRALDRGLEVLDATRTRLTTAVNGDRAGWQRVMAQSDDLVEEGRAALDRVARHGRQIVTDPTEIIEGDREGTGGSLQRSSGSANR